MTNFHENSSDTVIKGRIQEFYDLGSPLYLEVYGENIHDGYYITGKESRQEAQENLTRFIAEKARIKKGAKILDVGCGMGGSSLWLAENFEATTVGITISPVQVDIARRLARERKVDCSFLLMDAENMYFDETFDIIWVVGASTHFQNQEKFVKSATTFLNKGGKFIVFDWMVNENIADPHNDCRLQPVSEGMLLSSLCSINTYLNWLIQYGYRIVYSEDITNHTIKTWDDALSVIMNPSIWRLAPRVTKDELIKIIHFMKCIRPMKRAMERNLLVSGIIVAERL